MYICRWKKTLFVFDENCRNLNFGKYLSLSAETVEWAFCTEIILLKDTHELIVTGPAFVQ